MNSSDRKPTPSAMLAALAVLAGGTFAAVIPSCTVVPGYSVPGYGLAQALQQLPVDGLFSVARGLTPATGPWTKYQTLAVEVAEPTDVEVLAALAEVEEVNHQRLVAEAYAERLSGRHTLH